MWTKTYKVVGFLEPGVVKFGDKNLMIYISKEAIERYAHRLKGKPVTVGHIEGITESNAQDVSVGDVAICPEPGNCIVTVRDEEAANLLDSGQKFSCCWTPVRWGAAGSWHNVPYDKELLEMDFTHLAIVPDPRYEDVEVYANSKSTDQFNNEGEDEMSDIDTSAGSTTADSTGESDFENRKTCLSHFKNSLSAKQCHNLRRLVKKARSFDNALFDAFPGSDAKKQRNIQKYNLDPGVKHSADRYGDAIRTARAKMKTYNNEAQPSDNSERLAKIHNYLQKRQDRALCKQYETYEKPKNYVERTNTHFAGYKNCKYCFKNGKQFNHELFCSTLRSHKKRGC